MNCLYKAVRRHLSIYIERSDPYISVEVSYISFPSFSGSHCCYETLDLWLKERLDRHLIVADVAAKEIKNNLATKKEINDVFFDVLKNSSFTGENNETFIYKPK